LHTSIYIRLQPLIFLPLSVIPQLNRNAFDVNNLVVVDFEFGFLSRLLCNSIPLSVILLLLSTFLFLPLSLFLC